MTTLLASMTRAPGTGSTTTKFGALATRVERALTATGRAHPDATVLLAAHAGPMRVVHALAHGLDYVRHRRAIPEPPHATLVRYVLDGGGLRPGPGASE